jgi:hypothetical protein
MFDKMREEMQRRESKGDKDRFIEKNVTIGAILI